MPKPDTIKPDTYVDPLYEVVKLGESSKKKIGSPSTSTRTYMGSPSRPASLSSSLSPITVTEKALSSSSGISEKQASPSGTVTLRNSRSLSPRSSPRTFISSYTDDDLFDVKNYLNKRQIRDDTRGMFRLSKAMKWYLFYVFLASGFLYLYYVHPRIVYTLIDMNAVFVIIILGLNYGLTVASFLLTAWPASKTGPQHADGDTVFATFERVLTILTYALFAVDLFSNPLTSENISNEFYSKFILQIPHILTSIIGFPRRGTHSVAYQTLGFFLRVLAQFGSTLAVLLCIKMFGGFDDYIISLMLPTIPYAVFMFFFFRARIYGKILPSSKRHLFIMFGDKPIRDVMCFVTTLCYVLWIGTFMIIQIFFAIPSAMSASALALLQKTAAQRIELNILVFVWICSIVSLVVYGIPSLYHSLLDYPEKKPTTFVYRLGRKGNMKNLLAFCNVCYPEEEKDNSGNNQPNGAKMGGDQDDSVVNIDGKPGMSLKDNNKLHFMYDVSLVIACHLSENNIKPTLDAAIAANFPNTNIFVAHNGGSMAPPDKTGNVVRNTPAYNGVNYVYLPEGNKSIAVNWVIQHCVKTPLVMIIDDDVMLPPNVDIEGAYHELQLKPEMKAIAFTIRGVDNSNLWQVFQHIEYMQAGFNKIFQAQFGSVLTCHGAIALWRTDTVRDVFQEHNTEFNGEDLQMGLILRRMNKNFTIGVNAIEPVPTTAPKSLLYEKTKNEKSLFVQRIFSWDMAAHHFIGDFLEIMLTNWERSALILKPFLLLELWTQFQDWMRFIFIISLAQNDLYHTVFILVVLQLIQLVLVLVFDRVVLSNRPDVQTAFWILLFYPLYNVIIILFRYGGLMVNLMYYTPWNPPRIPISDREDRGELPPKVLLEYEVPRELQEFYWQNLWKSPAETYKRVAAKAKRNTSMNKRGETMHIQHNLQEEKQKMIEQSPSFQQASASATSSPADHAALPPVAPGQAAPQVQQLTTILQQQLQLQQLTHLLQLQLQQQLRPPQPQLPQAPATSRPRSSSFSHYRYKIGQNFAQDAKSFEKEKTASSTKLSGKMIDEDATKGWLKGRVERGVL